MGDGMKIDRPKFYLFSFSMSPFEMLVSTRNAVCQVRLARLLIKFFIMAEDSLLVERQAPV